MPLYEYKCLDCNRTMELLLISSKEIPACSHCKSTRLEKLMAAHSSMSGKSSFPGPGDTACCGSAPGEGKGCAGPGSCCGKTF